MKYLLDYMDCKDIEKIDIMAYCRHTHKVAPTVCKPHAHTTTDKGETYHTPKKQTTLSSPIFTPG